jgi:hypothetical protein
MKPLDAAGLRARGDARYRRGDVAGAMEAYRAVLELVGGDPAECAAALANRAACHLSRSDHGAAHDDCEVGQCRLTVSKPVLNAPMVSALETVM